MSSGPEGAAPAHQSAHGRLRVIWAPVSGDTSDWAWLLDDVERTRADRYRRAEDRARFVIAAGLAHRVIGAVLGERPDQPLLDRRCDECGGPHGRPRAIRGVVGCSISHSGDVAGFAWSDVGAVGLDVEGIRHVAPRALAAAQTPRESHSLIRECSQGGSPLPWWVRKEAVVKLTGEGLRSMPDYEVPVGRIVPGQWSLAGTGDREIDPITIADLRVDASHVGAVAFQGRPEISETFSAGRPRDDTYWEELIDV